MSRAIIVSLIVIAGLFSCNEKHEKHDNLNSEATSIYTPIEILEDNSTPAVDISKYTLISDSKTDRKAEAKEILKIKRKWPLAMQSKNPAEFDSILSKNFTFKGTTAFYNRADYIKDRTATDEWKITFVKYDNVTLQFFGNTAILSYVNHVRNEHVVSGAIEIEHITWVDFYLKENEKWKIGAAHSIDYRLEIPK